VISTPEHQGGYSVHEDLPVQSAVEGISAAYVRIFTVSVPEVMGSLDDSVHIYETSWGDVGCGLASKTY
jgi:hypothetical protein